MIYCINCNNRLFCRNIKSKTRCIDFTISA
nr:MAG TPA: hypothetical protein [Bacteriophage sp.]